MGEIAMPAELMAAMNIFGGSGDMTLASAENGSQNGSFDAVLGLLMANSTQVQTVPEMTETEADPEIRLADILSEALKGNGETKLPEIFSEKGAKAFIETLSRFLPEYDGDELPEETVSLWNDVPPEEKKAFAELLYAAAEFSEDESTQADKSPEDIVKIVSELVVNSAKKPEKKVSEKPDITDEAILIQGMNLFRPVETVSFDKIGEENPAYSETVSTVENEPVQDPGRDRLQATDTGLPVQTENAEATKAQNTEKIPFEDIQSAYEKLSEADPEDIVSFCRKLADELNVSVKETTPEAFKETAPELTDNGHIGYGRQGIQGLMSRVNRHDELPVDIGAKIIPEQAENKGAVTDIPLDESIPENEDISSQIMRQIDLYKDIFSESFSEREISMKLSPEALGSVEIRIRRSDKGFEITFTAEKAEAAELIGNKASELSDALASRGIALKELSVTRQIVTNESDGNLTDGTLSGNGGLYQGAQNGQSGSGRHFEFGGQAPSDGTSEAADESASDLNFNREAKLWVSA
ncbi:flagellar hook-length control protein FliK [Huintestinicola sp.]|uniref:flagellar hook-length control protein FliK n=1 Tax=Huintestinicola sp. TaxID=2981661 RepID=UPI003D7CED16